MMNIERRRQFFDRYPGLEQWYNIVSRIQSTIPFIDLVDDGKKDSEVFESVTKYLYGELDVELAKFITKYVTLASRRKAILRDYILKKDAVKILFDEGLKVEEVEAIYCNVMPRTLDISLSAPNRLLKIMEGAKYGSPKYTAIDILSAYNYSKVDANEMQDIIGVVHRMYNDLDPAHLPITEDGDIAVTAIRRILKIDNEDSGWASIKRMRKIARRWNQVDGRFLEILNHELPYHLQDWISPTGDIVDGYTFTPITSDAGLKKEGKEMDHCVGTYGGRCLAPISESSIHVYKIESEEERATLAIYEDIKGFEKEQAYGKNNARVSIRLNNAIEEFINTLNKDVDGRFNKEEAHKIRSEFRNRYKEEVDEREDWRKAITYLLPHFPEVQYLLDKEEELC